MSTEKTVASVAGVNAVAQGGTEMAIPAVPFLEAPLWYWTISGVDTVMTPQALIVIATGVLSVIALMLKIIGKRISVK